MMKNKIVIVVEGGVVQAVYSRDPTEDIYLLDHDDLKEEGKMREEREKIQEKAILGLHEVITYHV